MKEIDELPVAVDVEYVASHVSRVSLLDSTIRDHLVEGFKSYDMNATLFVLLLLCPKLRILQIDGPTKEFGKILKDYYECQATKNDSTDPIFPPIEMIDIIRTEWCCLHHDLAWQNISPYFFTHGIRSISVSHLTFEDEEPSADEEPSTELGRIWTLENVFLQGVRILPEQLAEIVRKDAERKRFMLRRL